MELALFHAASEWQSSLTLNVQLYCLVHSHAEWYTHMHTHSQIHERHAVLVSQKGVHEGPGG